MISAGLYIRILMLLSHWFSSRICRFLLFKHVIRADNSYVIFLLNFTVFEGFAPNDFSIFPEMVNLIGTLTFYICSWESSKPRNVCSLQLQTLTFHKCDDLWMIDEWVPAITISSNILEFPVCLRPNQTVSASCYKNVAAAANTNKSFKQTQQAEKPAPIYLVTEL